MELEALGGGHTAPRDVCRILEEQRPPGPTPVDDCSTFRIDPSVYLNSILMMLSRAGIQLLASLVIRPVGQKTVLVASTCVAGGLLVAWPSATSALTVLGLACVFEGMAHTANITILNILVDLFPTGVRSSAASLAHFSGRAGSVLGNIVFPLLFTRDCASAFYIAAAMVFAAAVLGFCKPRPSFASTPFTGLMKGVMDTAGEVRECQDL